MRLLLSKSIGSLWGFKLRAIILTAQRSIRREGYQISPLRALHHLTKSSSSKTKNRYHPLETPWWHWPTNINRKVHLTVETTSSRSWGASSSTRSQRRPPSMMTLPTRTLSLRPHRTLWRKSWELRLETKQVTLISSLTPSMRPGPSDWK